MPTACASVRTAVYRRRRSERTVHYRTVQTHLATWLELTCNRRQGAAGPAYVELEFRREPVWVLSVPKRLRDHLAHDPAVATLALLIFLSVVEQALCRVCPAAGPDSRIGAVALVHRFWRAVPSA